MLTTSKYLNGGSPLTCLHCSQPFPLIDGHHFTAWRGQNGLYYCASDCEWDALEARARIKRALS